jgi:prevent-host-death family protein
MDAISYRTAQTHLARTMDRVCDDREPLVITRTHAPSVVLISLEDYRALEEAAKLEGAVDKRPDHGHHITSIKPPKKPHSRLPRNLSDAPHEAEFRPHPSNQKNDQQETSVNQEHQEHAHQDKAGHSQNE